MKHFKAPNGEICAYEEDGSQDHLIPTDYIQISNDELSVELEKQNEKIKAEKLTPEVIRMFRASSYASESDPLFFKYNAGEATKEEWIAKREEIRALWPYPE